VFANGAGAGRGSGRAAAPRSPSPFCTLADAFPDVAAAPRLKSRIFPDPCAPAHPTSLSPSKAIAYHYPVMVFDGLTKNYRYPGWRVGWTLGPTDWIETLTRSGSAIDGGAPRWLQRAAVPLVEPAQAWQETQAMRVAFKVKRDFMLDQLKSMGNLFPRDPEGTFYCWGSVENLPPPLNDGFQFFREALKEKVITVPGEFFDVNPASTGTIREIEIIREVQFRRTDGGRSARCRPPQSHGGAHRKQD